MYNPTDEITLVEIKEDKMYVNTLNQLILKEIQSNGSIDIATLIRQVHSISPQLRQFCEDAREKFKITSTTDKGLLGKIVEFYLFGNMPNNHSCPDMPYGDIKTTHFKQCKSTHRGFNAKERLTLTNFGDPEKQQNIDTISEKHSIQETKFYEKIRAGIILVFKHDNVAYTVDTIYHKQIISIVKYDLDELFEHHADVKHVFQSDFDKIKKCVVEKQVTQSGQQYLHIHKHGCKNGVTRAFGFTNRFLTKLVSIQLGVPIATSGRSEYIEF
jgi:hypothetical protein